MKKVIMCIIAVLCAISIAAVNYHNKTQIKTDIEPIAKNFPGISGIESCYWYSETFDKSIIFNIGPASYKLLAFIKVSGGEKKALLQKYTFTEKSISFDDKLPISVLDAKDLQFLYSADLEKQVLGNHFLGDVFFDVNNGIFYISVENL